MRSLLLIGGICIAAIALGSVLFFFGPPSLQSEVNSALQSSTSSLNPAAVTGPVSFTVLEQGTDALSIPDRTNYRLDSQTDLASLWTLIYGNKDAPKIPNVNFSNHEVLAVFDGTHSTTGYSISVTGIMDQNATRTVTVTHATPDSSCVTASAVTSPFELVVVPKTSFALAHQDVTTANSCAAE
jgi:hypothetical protein